MAMFAPYQFYGILNMFNIFPDFVYPIFERDGSYFFQDVNERTGKIKEFVPVKQDAIKLIQNSDNFELSKVTNSSFSLGSDALVVFQLDNNHLQLGNIKELKSFLLTYNTEDEILNNEIQAFLEDWQNI